MHSLLPLVLVTFLGAEPVTVNTLDGNSLVGQLESVTATEAVVNVDGEKQSVPLQNVLEFSWKAIVTTPSENPEVQLVDGSKLNASVVVAGDEAAVSGETINAKVSRRQIRSARFSPLDAKIAESWEELRSRQPKEDLLIVRKGDVLDFIAGAIGDITEENVAVVASGRELQAPRAKLFGIVFADRPQPRGRSQAEVTLITGEKLTLESLNWDGTDWTFQLLAGLPVKVPAASVQRIDFGGGRIRPLADLAFNSDDSTSPNPLFPVVWFTSRNSPAGFGPEGKPLRIGDTDYTRGLWLCSNVVVRFRLNREYTRLQTVAGFELTYIEKMPKFDPQVQFIVESDGKPLIDESIRWNDPPKKLDLDLSDTRELVIKVISKSAHPGVLEFFALGDARLLK